MSMGFEGNELGRIDPRALEDKGDLLSPREMSRYEGELARPERFGRKSTSTSPSKSATTATRTKSPRRHHQARVLAGVPPGLRLCPGLARHGLFWRRVLREHGLREALRTRHRCQSVASTAKQSIHRGRQARPSCDRRSGHSPRSLAGGRILTNSGALFRARLRRAFEKYDNAYRRFCAIAAGVDGFGARWAAQKSGLSAAGM
jgi:hypothetical protein